MKKLLLSLCLFVVIASAGIYVGGMYYRYDIYQAAMDHLATEANTVKKQAQIDGVDISYLENDQQGKKPTLVFIHGFGAYKENWLLLSGLLKNDFHIITLDLPGHGESSIDLNSNYDIDIQVKTLHSFMSSISDKPFHIAGNSMGGAITALYAATYPQDVLSAILLDPGFINDVKSEYDEYLSKGENPLIPDSVDDFPFLVDFVMEKAPFSPFPITAVSAEKMVGRLEANKKIWIDIFESEHNYDFKNELTRIKAPTLVAWGRQDRVLSAGNAPIFKSLIPNSKIHIFENIGHAPIIEVPMKSADVFLRLTSTSTKPRNRKKLK